MFLIRKFVKYLFTIVCISVSVFIYFRNINIKESKALIKDISITKNLEISEDKAIEIVKLRKKKKDSGYNHIVVKDTNQNDRVYDIIYRVEDSKVIFYLEKEEGIYLKLR